jgi:hypothetical protein
LTFAELPLMRGLVAVAVLACTIAPLTQAAGQRKDDNVAGYTAPPQGTTQDTSRRRSREAVFMDRAIVGMLVNGSILAPTVVAYQTTKNPSIMAGGVLAQLMVTSFVVARMGDNRQTYGRRDWLCSPSGRLFSAFTGALTGAAGGILFSEARYQAEHAHTHDEQQMMRPLGIAALTIGIPLGAAAAIYDCR